MKQIIPFKKEIVFKTMISKITSISLEHTLSLKDEETIGGDFIVSGSYKMTEASQLDEDFSYKIPIEITIDDKYDTKELTLEIDDFIYEVVDEEKLLLNIDLCLDNLELKKQEEIISSYDEFEEEKPQEIPKQEETRISTNENITEDLFLDTSTSSLLEVPSNKEDVVSDNNNHNTKDIKEKMEELPTSKSDDIPSIFSAFKDTEETFATYCVYIIREGDSLDAVINKYKTTRDTLAEYNDLSDIRIGTKLIIPNSNE